MNIPTISSRNKYWNNRFIPGTIYSKKPSKIIKLILPYIKNCNTILIIGEGYGRNGAFLAKKGFNVLSTDISDNAIKLGKKIYEDLSNLKFQKQDVFDLNYKKGRFDAIIGFYMFNLFSQKEINKIIRKISKVLRKGDKFCGNFLSIDDAENDKKNEIEKNLVLYDNSQLVKFYRKNEVNSLLKNKFIIDELVKVAEFRYINIFLKKKIVSRSWLVCCSKK